MHLQSHCMKKRYAKLNICLCRLNYSIITLIKPDECYYKPGYTLNIVMVYKTSVLITWANNYF